MSTTSVILVLLGAWLILNGAAVVLLFRSPRARARRAVTVPVRTAGRLRIPRDAGDQASAGRATSLR
jgi:hypothetical protein